MQLCKHLFNYPLQYHWYFYVQVNTLTLFPITNGAFKHKLKIIWFCLIRLFDQINDNVNINQ